MATVFDLSNLNPAAFENLVNALATKVLGSGSTGFSPGADAGRDGYFEGEAPYPSTSERWKGTWYIQSKFHAPHLTSDAQAWLIQQVKREITAFNKDASSRHWPNNWIIGTNIVPSATAESGSHDKIRKMVASATGGKVNVAIWGGDKILQFLHENPGVAEAYGHFLTPGHVLTRLYAELGSLGRDRATLDDISDYFIVSCFCEQIYMKLDRSATHSVRPAVHDLFIDLPYSEIRSGNASGLLATLSRSSAQCHRYSFRADKSDSWRVWNQQLKRARVVVVKGGPGQGKSTIGQYLCQIHRAFFILSEAGPRVSDLVKTMAEEVRNTSRARGFWPVAGRIPIQVELKEYAHWRSARTDLGNDRLLSYVAELISKSGECLVSAKSLRDALSKFEWIIIFDGLDEVPNDHKDKVANEVLYFLNEVVIRIDADVLAICTSRPQGYSGQFDSLEGPVVELMPLTIEIALQCATPLLMFGQSESEGAKAVQILTSAVRSPNVQELMTTPLQSHIMATVVRDGGHPPERRWRLFKSFYEVMKRRESLKNFGDPRVAKLLRDEDLFLKAVHTRLGFVLHARAELSSGAQTVLTRGEFRELVEKVVDEFGELDAAATVDVVMEAVTERLVLVSTPDSGEQVRFDIRQLQEFFAAEFLYEGRTAEEVAFFVKTLGIDAHWREVMYFLLSALITTRRKGEFAVAALELIGINSGDLEAGDALYRRRTAPAAYIVCRLLMEGVIEENKQDRKHLKAIFDSIGGMADFESVKFLINIRPPKSRLWVIEQLHEQVACAKPTEYIGALYLLGFSKLESNLDDCLEAAFFSLPLILQRELIQAWAPDVSWTREEGDPGQRRQTNEHSDWVVGVAVCILNSDRWTLFDTSDVTPLLNLCRVSEPRFSIACAKHGLHPGETAAIATCLVLDEELGIDHDGEEIDCGVVKAGMFEESWWNGKLPVELQGYDSCTNVSLAGGAFQLLLQCLDFAKNPDRKTLEKIAKSIQFSVAGHIAYLPDCILALIPVENWQSSAPCSVNHILSLGDENNINLILHRFRSSLLPPYSGTTIYGGLAQTDENWSKFIQRLPKRAIEFAFSIEDDRTYHIAPRFSPELDQLLLNDADEAATHILRWGTLTSVRDDLLQRLGQKLLKSPPNVPPLTFRYFDVIYPFTVHVLSDANLLGWLGPALTKWWLMPSARRKVGGRSLSDDFGLSDVLAAYGVSFCDLRAVVATSSWNSSARSGALALSWLMDADMQKAGGESVLDIEQEHTNFLKLVTPANEPWLAFAFVVGILFHAEEGNEKARASVTDLLARRDDGHDSRSINLALKRWREWSTSPVTSLGVLDDFLRS